MTLIDDQMTVISNDIIDFSFTHQALDERNIDDTCRFSFPAANNADLLWIYPQKSS